LVVIEITGGAYDGHGMRPFGRSETARAVALLAPPLALMALIYVLSAQPDLNSGLGAIDLIGRKVLHMTEYGLLWWLWSRALGFRRPLLAAAIALAYAATDEYHQTFVAGRHGSPVDWGIDAAGVAVAWIAQRALLRARSSRAA
jgi:VanZ family protein